MKKILINLAFFLLLINFHSLPAVGDEWCDQAGGQGDKYGGCYIANKYADCCCGMVCIGVNSHLNCSAGAVCTNFGSQEPTCGSGAQCQRKDLPDPSKPNCTWKDKQLDCKACNENEHQCGTYCCTAGQFCLKGKCVSTTQDFEALHPECKACDNECKSATMRENCIIECLSNKGFGDLFRAERSWKLLDGCSASMPCICPGL